MKNTNYKNILNKISFLKLAGVKKIITLEVFDSYVKLCYMQIKEPFYKITSSTGFNSLRIIDSKTENYSGNAEEIEILLNNFTNKNEATGATLIIGINEYRTKTVVINKEEEDINLWFLENTDKFIPTGRPADEFRYTYKKYNEDEDHYYFIIALSRNDYLEKLTGVCKKTGVKILAVTPFLLSFHSVKTERAANSLFIDVSGKELKYSYTDSNNNLFVGEIYHNIYPGSETNQEINSEELNSCLRKLHETLKLTANFNSHDIQIYISAESKTIGEFQKHLTNIFNTTTANKNYTKVDPYFFSHMLTALNLLTAFDDSLNLLDKELLKEKRFEFEKDITQRLTLACGAVLMFLLLLTYGSESYFSKRIKDSQDDLIEVNAKSKVKEKLESENTKLKANLFLLNKLKGKNLIYSNILAKLSDVVTEKSIFTGIKLSTSSTVTGGVNADKQIELTLEGLAINQEEITKVMSNMETEKVFHKIALVYSSTLDAKSVTTNIFIGNKEIVKFNLSSEYHADK